MARTAVLAALAVLAVTAGSGELVWKKWSRLDFPPRAGTSEKNTARRSRPPFPTPITGDHAECVRLPWGLWAGNARRLCLTL